VQSPAGGRFGGRGGNATARSAGRFPDGADTDSNCQDFQLQAATSMPIASEAGATNIKVTSVADFAPGQTIIVDSGANRETAVIATVGTAGGTTVNSGSNAGATELSVGNAFGFAAGQTITIDTGANAETAVVASVTFGRRGFGGGFGAARINVAAPLKFAHAEGAQVSGSGITLTAGLTKAHEAGTSVAGSVPTPGAPNQYVSKAH
jgi:hypothetical protein